MTTVCGSGEVGLLDATGLEATFHRPFALAYWRQRLLVADTGNHCLREVCLGSSTSDSSHPLFSG